MTTTTASSPAQQADLATRAMRHHTHYHDGHIGGEKFMERVAAAVASGMGTVAYLFSSTVAILAYVIANIAKLVGFDPYPFILLNLVFSAVAFFTGSLVIIAQKAQIRMDHANEVASAKHREELSQLHTQMLNENTQLTAEIHELSRRLNVLASLMMKLLTQVFMSTCVGKNANPQLLQAAAAAIDALDRDATIVTSPAPSHDGTLPLPFPPGWDATPSLA